MSYTEWFDAHARKHHDIVQKLLDAGYNAEKIIDYFDFENMLRNEPEFCPLYAEQRKCHDMEELNCYLCACPNFRFNDEAAADAEGKIRYSRCGIDSKEGRIFEHGNALHQDCSRCTVPHHKAYIRKHFDTDWRSVMKNCPEIKGRD